MSTDMIKITKTNEKGLTYSFAVCVAKNYLANKLEGKIKEMQPKVNLKGFRVGKVPVAHIRKMYGRSIMNDVIEQTINESSQQALADNKVRPAGQPKIEMIDKPEDIIDGKADLNYTIEVEVIPEFEPVNAATLTFTRLTSDIADEEIEARIKELTAAQKSYKKKAKTAKAKKNDAVLINFKGRVDGEVFEGGTAEGHQLVIGSNTFIPGFEEQLIGTKAGETLEVAVSFPEEYQVAELAGKPAVFTTEILEVQGECETILDDELAKKFGLEDLKALQDTMKTQMENEYENQSRTKLKRVILDELDKKHNFDLPPQMVEAEFSGIWAQIEKEKEQGSLDQADKKKSDKALKAEYRKIAERRVRLGLVLAEMGTKTDITISNEELSQAVMAEAQRYPGQEQMVIDFYKKNPNAIDNMRAPLYEEKVIDFIVEKAKIVDKTVAKDELFAEDDDLL